MIFSLCFLILQTTFAPELTEVAERGDFERVKSLIRQGSGPNQTDEFHRTALMWSAANGHFEVVKLLLNSKSDPNFENAFGNTALAFAAIYGNSEVAQLLIKNKADVNHKNKYGSTPLLWAAAHGHFDVAEKLIQSGALTNQTLSRVRRASVFSNIPTMEKRFLELVQKNKVYTENKHYFVNFVDFVQKLPRSGDTDVAIVITVSIFKDSHF